MRYRTTHITRYDYTEPVSVCQNEVRLTPRSLAHQMCHDGQVRIEPRPALRSSWIDAFGNDIVYFSIEEPTSRLELVSTYELTVDPPPTWGPRSTPPWEEIRLAAQRAALVADVEATQFRFPSPFVPMLPELATYAAKSFSPRRAILDATLELTQRMKADFRYDPTFTTIATPVMQVFEARRGVCQDFAHLQIGCLRALGLPARYVSGYLRTYPPPGKPRLVGADASHAWVSVYAGEKVGWVDFDPTNGVATRDEHVTVAWGRDYGDVSPVRGVITGGGSTRMTVSVDVLPLD